MVVVPRDNSDTQPLQPTICWLVVGPPGGGRRENPTPGRLGQVVRVGTKHAKETNRVQPSCNLPRSARIYSQWSSAGRCILHVPSASQLTEGFGPYLPPGGPRARHHVRQVLHASPGWRKLHFLVAVFPGEGPGSAATWSRTRTDPTWSPPSLDGSHVETAT